MNLFTEMYPSASAPLLYLCVFLSLRCFSYLRFVVLNSETSPSQLPAAAQLSRRQLQEHNDPTTIPLPVTTARLSNDNAPPRGQTG